MLYLTGEQKKHLKLVLDIAIGVGASRPQLEVVSVKVEPELTTFITSDGFRLAAMRFHDSDVRETFTVNVDAKTLKKLLPRGKKPVELSVSRQGVAVDGECAATPVDVNYPDWRQVLPKTDEPSETDKNFQWPLAEMLVKLCGYGLEQTGYLRRSIHDEDVIDEHDVASWSSHAWAWTRDAVEYLYILMPLHGYPVLGFDSLGGVAWKRKSMRSW